MIAAIFLVVVSLLALAVPTDANAQVQRSTHVRWADLLLEYSSELDEYEFSAMMVLGKPNVLPVGGSRPGAWAVKAVASEDEQVEASGDQWVVVGFNQPIEVALVTVAESNNPGSIKWIYLYDSVNTPYKVYDAIPMATTTGPRLFNLIIPKTGFRVHRLKLVTRPDAVPGWNEIDAIGISDRPDSAHWAINLAEGLEWRSKPENLGPTVNSPFRDLIDAISADGNDIYLSRYGHPENLNGADGPSDIWVTRRADTGWSVARRLPAPVNNEAHNYVNAITPDGNLLCLGNRYEPDGSAGGAGVSYSIRTSAGWSIPRPMEIQDFYNYASTASYYLTNDRTRLLSALHRDDSRGGHDLYVSTRIDDSTWSLPVNLGSQINTGLSEIGPMLAADGVTLYFASQGHSGYGGFDLFMTKRLDDTWTRWSEPQNLGPGINSPGSDMYYFVPAAGDYAYFSSNMEGGFGSSDIYRIALPAEVRPQPVALVRGRTFNAKTNGTVPATIRYEDLGTGKLAGLAYSDPVSGEFKIVLPLGKQYGVHAEAEGHYPISAHLSLAEEVVYKEIRQDLSLIPVEVGSTIRLNNIFFASGKAELLPESVAELERVVAFLLREVDRIIELRGHTDDIGSPESNHLLSLQRAKAVQQYLLERGITVSRVTATGFGETVPVASNSIEAGRQANRRVEFVIIK